MRKGAVTLLFSSMVLAVHAASAHRVAPDNPSPSSESGDPAPTAKDRANRAAAIEMVGKLDMTSFRNSIGPARRPAAHTLADYGYTAISSFDDGWAQAKRPDGSWTFGIFVLDNGRTTKRLCVTDNATNGGTYQTATAIDVAPRAGLWRAVRVLGKVSGC